MRTHATSRPRRWACFALAGAGLAPGCGAEAPASGGVTLSLGAPAPVLAVRNVDRAALGVRVSVDGEPVEAERTAVGWLVRVDVPEGEGALIEVEWFEIVEGEPLTLAAWSRDTGPLNSARTIEVDAEAIDTATFDSDGDGVSNLDERRSDGDPFVADAAPGRDVDTDVAPGLDPALDAVLSYIDPVVADTIVVDGAFDPVWQRAQFEGLAEDDGTAPPLRVNRLLAIDEDNAQDPALQDGVPDYIWFGMHDGRFLYLFVQTENGRNGQAQTPKREDGFWLNDDAIGVIIDPNLSRDPGLQSDDLYIGIPLVPFPGEDRPSLQVFMNTLPVPPGREYGTCPCPGFRTGWELKIPLGELGVTVGQPFGLELQVHEDNDDDRVRDAMYGWATPPIGQQDQGLSLQSPSRLGTVVLARP